MIVKTGLNRASRAVWTALLALGLAGGAPAPAVALPLPPLSEVVASTLSEARAAHAALGLVVADAATGEVLLAVRPEAPLVPASVMKLATSAVALRTLGPDFRFATRLGSLAPLASGTLGGDLVLAGSGDPSLLAGDLAALARELKGQGLARVEGDLVVDASGVAAPGWAPGWSVDDLSEPYAPLVSGLNLEANLRSEPATPSPRLVPDPDPAMSAGRAMRAALEQVGIPVAGSLRRGLWPPGAAILAEHQSAPLATLLVAMNKESRNLYAEALFRRLGAAGSGSAAAGAEAVTRGLLAIGVASEDVRVADGSGLSRYDLLTPRAIARLLCAMHAEPAFVASLPVAGVDGTLAHRFAASPLRGRLRAKTGTMGGISAIAGYLEGTQGRRWVVTLTVNGFTGPVRPVQALQETLLERIWSRLEAAL